MNKINDIALTFLLIATTSLVITVTFRHVFKIDQPQPAPPIMQPVPSTPSPTNQPAPSLVDFEDMAGLDVATQELLNERYRDIGPADFEKRLRRLEWAVSALSDRVFGKSLLPGEIGTAGIGDTGTGQDAVDNE